MFHRPLTLIFVSASLALAEDALPSGVASEKAVEPVKPSIKKLDETRYQIGDVVFDEKSREIRFPARVNMTVGQLEYLIVHVNGNVHESLLATEISPTHLNLAFTLLRYPPSHEFYRLPSETEGAPGQSPPVSAEVNPGARVNLDVEWAQEGKIRRNPVNEWIQHGLKTTSMPAGPWVYGGSDVFEGKFVAETTGDIAAIFLSQSAILNYPGADNDNDDVWTPFPKRIPADGTNVTVIIAPYQNAKPLPKP